MNHLRTTLRASGCATGSIGGVVFVRVTPCLAAWAFRLEAGGEEMLT